jgi:hypothetical protein
MQNVFESKLLWSRKSGCVEHGQAIVRKTSLKPLFNFCFMALKKGVRLLDFPTPALA